MIAVNKPKAGYVKKSELKIALFKDQQMKIDAIIPPPYTGPTVDKYVVSGNNGVQLRTCWLERGRLWSLHRGCSCQAVQKTGA